MFSTWVSGTDHCGFLRGSFTTETQLLSCGRYRQTWQCSIVHHHDQLKLVIVFFIMWEVNCWSVWSWSPLILTGFQAVYNNMSGKGRLWTPLGEVKSRLNLTDKFWLVDMSWKVAIKQGNIMSMSWVRICGMFMPRSLAMSIFYMAEAHRNMDIAKELPYFRCCHQCHHQLNVIPLPRSSVRSSRARFLH